MYRRYSRRLTDERRVGGSRSFTADEVVLYNLGAATIWSPNAVNVSNATDPLNVYSNGIGYVHGEHAVGRVALPTDAMPGMAVCAG